MDGKWLLERAGLTRRAGTIWNRDESAGLNAIEHDDGSVTIFLGNNEHGWIAVGISWELDFVQWEQGDTREEALANLDRERV